MNDRQKAFCAEYIIDFNGTQAAIKAGYSEKTAGAKAFELLKLVEIQEEIRYQINERSKRTEITQDRVLLEIARLAFNDPRKAFNETGDLLPIQQWPDEVAAAISAIKVTEITQNDGPITYLKEIKFWDKGKQIELAGRHLGLWIDRVSLSGDKDNPIKTITKIELVPFSALKNESTDTAA